MNNKCVAGGFIFAIFQWMAYMALAGIDFQDWEHVRCKGAVLRDGMAMITGTLRQIPAGIRTCACQSVTCT